jgi:hypothetical protein
MHITRADVASWPGNRGGNLRFGAAITRAAMKTAERAINSALP